MTGDGRPGEYPTRRATIHPGIASGVSAAAVWTIAGAPGSSYGTVISP